MTADHHAGSCQCGAVAYEVDVDISMPVVCNCSRCQRLGSRLAFAPLGNFRLLRGEDEMTEYRFNSGKIRHLFCRTCGIESFAYGELPDGTPMAAINVNCLDGVEPLDLPIMRHDGRSE